MSKFKTKIYGKMTQEQITASQVILLVFLIISSYLIYMGCNDLKSYRKYMNEYNALIEAKKAKTASDGHKKEEATSGKAMTVPDKKTLSPEEAKKEFFKKLQQAEKESMEEAKLRSRIDQIRQKYFLNPIK